MVNVLIVEKDEELKNFLKKLLRKEGYQVRTTEKGSQTILLVDKFQPDLILLDRNITDLQDESICWEIKREYPDLPIILLLENIMIDRIVKLYRAGADDFISKPIKIKSLLSRIRIQLAGKQKRQTILKIDDLTLNPKTFIVKRAKKIIKLTRQEFKLLKFLMRHQDKVLTREMILSRVWSYDADVQSRAVDVYIGYLRKKIDSGFKKKLIQTVRGFGYRIRE